MSLTLTGLDQLKRATKSLEKLPATINRAAYRAANTTLDRVDTQVRKYITSEVNLKPGYVSSLTRKRPATAAKPVADLAVRVRPVSLARFDMKLLTTAAPRAKGDPYRGIPPGQKAAGVSVMVKRGRRKTIKRAFLIKTLAGAADGSNFGVFLSDKYGGLDALYGPSPDQIFRSWRDRNKGEVQSIYARQFESQLRFEISGTRK